MHLDQAAAEEHLHNFLEDGQDAAVVHAQASVQELRHVQHLRGPRPRSGRGVGHLAHRPLSPGPSHLGQLPVGAAEAREAALQEEVNLALL